MAHSIAGRLRNVNTLAGRLGTLQLIMHLVLVPLLLYRLDAVVRTNATETFIRHAHAYARALANELELGDVLLSPSRTVIFLDTIVQGGGCAYAAIDFGGRIIGSSLAETPPWIRARGSDRKILHSPHHVFAVAVKIRRDAGVGALYIGFDTRPMLRQISSAWRQILLALLVYACVSVAAAVIMARLVARPLTQLQRASRRAAQGDPAERIRADSSMTEIVELAQVLEFMRSELIGTVEKLRAEIGQRELEKTERAALESHLLHEQRLATVGTFASGLAHEFNNILLPLLLFCEESLDDIAPDHPARRNVEQVMTLAARASDVIAKMLAFGRPLANCAPELFDPVSVLTETSALFRVLMPANIVLQLDLPALALRVSGDSTQFSQVVLNLFSNATYAMRTAGGRLAVTVRQIGGGTGVEVRIKDDGVGMSDELREHIFEPFFTTRGVGEGTGLGLSVVHGIVTGMGGTIDVVTAPGKGAEFIIVLPSARENANANRIGDR